MLLLDRQGAKRDTYSRVSSLEEAKGLKALAPFALLEALAAANDARRLGALVDNTASVDALEPFFDKLDLIVVVFPSGVDGRGFSLARRLRQRGFAGTLRASGPLFSDQFPQVLACGFDEVEIPDAIAARQPVEQWLAALSRISLTYQRDFGSAENILDQRRRARGDGEPNVFANARRR